MEWIVLIIVLGLGIGGLVLLKRRRAGKAQ